MVYGHSNHSKDRYLQVQFLPPDHQTLEPVATLNNKCTYCTDIQHFDPASYHQSSNWAVYGLSSCSCWSTSQLVQHQPVFTCTSREILCCHRDLVVGVYSLLFILHRMWRCTTWRDTSPGLPRTDVDVDVDVVSGQSNKRPDSRGQSSKGQNGRGRSGNIPLGLRFRWIHLFRS